MGHFPQIFKTPSSEATGRTQQTKVGPKMVRTCSIHMPSLVAICRRTAAREETSGSAIAEEPRDALRQLKYYGRFLTELLTRSSANPEEPCEHTVS